MSRLPGSGHLPPVDTKPAVIVANPRHTDEEKGFVNDAVAPEQRLRLLPKWLRAIFRGPAIVGDWYKERTMLEKRVKVRSIDNAAPGYPRLAAFVDSDANFMIYRRFGYLRTRLLLYHQDVLRAREEELDRLDKTSREHLDTERQLCSRRQDEDQEFPLRTELYRKLDEEIQTYDELLLRSAALYELDEPVDRNRQSVAGVIWNDSQLAQPDRNYIHYLDDLVAIGGDKEHSWVHLLFERGFTKASRSISRFLFTTRVQAAKAKNPYFSGYLYSKQKFDFVVACFFTAIITGIIMAPVFVLTKYQDQNDIKKDCIILGFTAMFAMICSACTTAKRHEIFAATAAYGAVLVVFISQGTGSNSGDSGTH